MLPVGRRRARGGQERGDDVALVDGLGPVLPPRRQEEDREALDEVDQEPEGPGARADGDRGAQGDGLRGRRRDGPLDHEAALQVLRERLVLVDHDAEVDRAAHAGGGGGLGVALGRPALALLERHAVVRRLHGVHEVVGDVDAVERLVQALSRRHVAAHHRDVVGDARGVPGEGADVVALREEAGDQRRSREPAGTGDEDAHRIHHGGLRARPGRRTHGRPAPDRSGGVGPGRIAAPAPGRTVRFAADRAGPATDCERKVTN
ncbi:unannotated protein [freshwater metagenome]|uniref:Unannotated protein n=1 Tax=freshwater metagenome TaxID=449393 RepID=A0A6J7K0V4_9ZZZZ